MEDRQDQSDMLAAQLAAGGAGIGFFLAGIASLFVNYGLALGCYVGAAFMFLSAHKFHAVSRLMLRLPVSFSNVPQRTHKEAFLLASYVSLAATVVVSAIAVQSFMQLTSAPSYGWRKRGTALGIYYRTNDRESGKV